MTVSSELRMWCRVVVMRCWSFVHEASAATVVGSSNFSSGGIGVIVFARWLSSLQADRVLLINTRSCSSIQGGTSWLSAAVLVVIHASAKDPAYAASATRECGVRERPPRRSGREIWMWAVGGMSWGVMLNILENACWRASSRILSASCRLDGGTVRQRCRPEGTAECLRRVYATWGTSRSEMRWHRTAVALAMSQDTADSKWSGPTGEPDTIIPPDSESLRVLDGLIWRSFLLRRTARWFAACVTVLWGPIM